MNPLDFEGSYLYGPKTFAEITGRKKLWAKERPTSDSMKTDVRSCPLCGECAPETLFNAQGWLYVRCEVCSMVYQPAPPTEEALREYYQDGAAPNDWVEYTQQHALELELDKRKFRWALEACDWPGDVNVPSLLDIGCSTGTLLEVASNMVGVRDAVLAGVEINPAARGLAEERVFRADIYGGLGSELERLMPFDLVSLFEVLEHVLDPEELLRQASGYMNKKGTMLICVPNMNSLAARVLHEKAPMFGLGHISMFTPETLRQMILKVMPAATVQFFSIISMAKELSNFYNFQGPFSCDKPDPMHFDPNVILSSLGGYKLVAVVKQP